MEHRIFWMLCDRPLILRHRVVWIFVRSLSAPGEVEELFRVIQLIRERRLLQPTKHLVCKPPAIKSRKRQQSLTLRFGPRLSGLSSLRKRGRNQSEYRTRQQIVDFRRHMHMFIDLIAADSSVMGGVGKNLLRIDQRHSG